MSGPTPHACPEVRSTRARVVAVTLSLAAACSSFACTRDNPAFNAHASESLAGDGGPGSSRTTTDDGDGDPTTGDGDGDSTTDDPPICGNGVVEQGEACDDGNTIDDDACTNACEMNTPGFCGDGTLDPGEQCDDGNALDDDLCAADCTWTFAMCEVADPIVNCMDCLNTYCCTNVVAACVEAPTCLCAIQCVHNGGDLGACSMQCAVSDEVAILIRGSSDCFLDECAELCL